MLRLVGNIRWLIIAGPYAPGGTGAGGHVGLVLGVVLARFHQELEEVGHRKPPRLH